MHQECMANVASEYVARKLAVIPGAIANVCYVIIAVWRGVGARILSSRARIRVSIYQSEVSTVTCPSL